MKINRIMIITGGTGGHIFPGLVIANYLKKKYKVKWIGSNNNNLEYILISKKNIDVEYINISSLLKYNFFFNFFIFIKNIFIVLKKIIVWKPDLVLGFGGYISFYGIFSSWLYGIPTIIHEQNSIAGLSNKILYYIATKTIQAFPGTFGSNISTVGNPIRKKILSISSPKIRLLNRFGPIRILVLGGSQGSNIINNIILKIINILNYKKFIFFHQVGFINFNNHKEYVYNNNIKNKNYKFVNFITNISKAYNWADLVICRSGALTVSEINTIGLAAIFIPYKHKDYHQYFNAKFLNDIGAAIIIEEKNLNIKKLCNIILKLNRNKLFYMSNLGYKNRIKNSNKKFLDEIYNI